MNWNFFFKLMNNSVLGKATENLRNRRDIELITRRLFSFETKLSCNNVLSQVLIAIEIKDIKNK